MGDRARVVNFKGFEFVRDESMRGLKYAIRYEGARAIHVSPAVFELLNTEDAELVAKNLRVKERKYK